MMQLLVSDKAYKDIEKFSSDLKKQIYNHFLKISQEDISRKHLHYGLPYFVEKIGYSCRIIYDIQDNKIFIIRIFDDHKNYEKWYKK
ncbi:MAG TPA: hypothetical protein P5530_01470 [Candidatus Diapherotrites archaeon]|nr:hypothetical protein [Candidatus Diapherotrites archaeon]